MHIFKKNKVKMSSLYLVFNAGSMYEENGKLGTFHLMEHLVCKTFDDLLDEFTKRGITYNAYTSSEVVVFWFSGLSKQLTKEMKEDLVKRVTSNIGVVTEESFMKEKMVVLQEYEDTFTDPIGGHFLNIIRSRFNSYLPIGKRSDIESFSFEDMKEAFNNNFIKPSMIIEIGGEKSDLSFIEFDKKPRTKRKLKYRNYQAEVTTVPTVEGVNFVYFLPRTSVSKKDVSNLNIANLMLAYGLNSPLYQELREKRGLIYGVYSTFEPCVNDSIFYTCFQTMTENVKEAQKVYGEIINNIETVLTKERFNDIVEMLRNKFEEENIFTHKYAEKLIKGLASTQLNSKTLENIKFEDVIETSKKYLIDYETFIR